MNYEVGAQQVPECSRGAETEIWEGTGGESLRPRIKMPFSIYAAKHFQPSLHLLCGLWSHR